MGLKYHDGVTIVPKSDQCKYSGKENITFFFFFFLRGCRFQRAIFKNGKNWKGNFLKSKEEVGRKKSKSEK